MYLYDLWGVKVLELDSHPDLNKGPDLTPYACPKTNPIHYSISHTKPDNQPFDCTTFVWKS